MASSRVEDGETIIVTAGLKLSLSCSLHPSITGALPRVPRCKVMLDNNDRSPLEKGYE